MLTCVGCPNGEKVASTKFNVNPCKSIQVGGQTKCKSKTCVDLRRLASPFGQGDFFSLSIIVPLFYVKNRKRFSMLYTWEVDRTLDSLGFGLT